MNSLSDMSDASYKASPLVQHSRRRLVSSIRSITSGGPPVCTFRPRTGVFLYRLVVGGDFKDTVTLNVTSLSPPLSRRIAGLTDRLDEGLEESRSFRIHLEGLRKRQPPDDFIL
jgi:hypothetical protein